jgi:hypothetical protein
MRILLFRLALAPMLWALLGSTLQSAAPKIAAASVDPNDRRHIIVNFDNPAPTADAVDKVEFWIVYERNTTSNQRLFLERVDALGLAPTSDEKHVDLYLAEQVSGNPAIKEVQILLATKTDLVRVDPLTSPSQLAIPMPQAGALAAAKSKSDADIYFNGSYTAVLGGDPVYDIDTFAGYMWAIQKGDGYFGRLGLYGQLRTKMSAKADPNSFLTYAVYQNVLGNGGWWGPFQSPIFNYRLFGAEFDRSATQLNLINSPVITLPFRPVAPPNQENSKVTAWPQFNLLFGTEFVDVRKSVLAPTGHWHTRGLLGATFATGYAPKIKSFDSWQLTSSWQVRLPSAPEIFYDDRFAPIDPTTGKPNLKKTPPMLGTQPRHSFDTKFTYNYAPWGGFTLEHTYGSLPPIFNKTDQSFALGLTFSLQEFSFGRYSILRPY